MQKDGKLTGEWQRTERLEKVTVKRRQHDAWVVAEWMRTADANGALASALRLLSLSAVALAKGDANGMPA